MTERGLWKDFCLFDGKDRARNGVCWTVRLYETKIIFVQNIGKKISISFSIQLLSIFFLFNQKFNNMWGIQQ